MKTNLDDDVRWHLYDITMREGVPPSMARLSSAVGVDVRDALERLMKRRMVVLQPGSGEILMAGPFSAVPTTFRVTVPAYSCYANCVWDALGVAATLQSDAEIDTSCADCGAAAKIFVRSDAVVGEGFMHFALPPRMWWENIVFT